MPKGTITYTHSTNLGDYIQTIAAAQLLGPGPLTHLDRESLHRYDGPDLQLLVNGWFMQNPSNWPPAKAIFPLFLSFHINPTVADQMLSSAGRAYLKKHQPIGCRDEYTRRLLERHQIQAYLSACVTLTLKRSSFVSNETPRKGILVLSALERMVPNTQELWEQKKIFPWAVQQLKAPLKRFKAKQANERLQTFLSQQNRPITRASQILKTPLQNTEDYLAAARQQLEKIACAEVVITSRIHTALPAVALGTPVIFLNDGLEHPNQASRLEGLLDLFPVCNTKALAQINLENLIPPDKHHPFVRLITKKTTTFFNLK
jgi:hypothetical protein